MKLSGRRALITGTTSGIGRAIALRFAREGAHVALTGRRRDRLADVAAEARAAGVTVVEIVADHTNPADNARAVDTAAERLGGLDILVNAAGVLGNDSILDPKPGEWRRILDTNLEAVYDLTHRAAPHIIKAGPGGSILNLSSMAGIRAYAQVLAYCVSKAALNTLTQCLALELAPHGVRVNAINPGVVVSELHTASGAVADYTAFLERARTTHPLGRPGQPEEIAALAVFLTSEEAGWITGGLHIADGGRSLTSLR
jgi:NAD(P)-dependent dehydrogenase (short-subunit alcohol dehydrogenase family)